MFRKPVIYGGISFMQSYLLTYWGDTEEKRFPHPIKMKLDYSSYCVKNVPTHTLIIEAEKSGNIIRFRD